MCNGEEPEGPNIPPKKTKSALIKTKNNSLKLKGIIAAFTGAFCVIAYLIYYKHLLDTGEKLNELYKEPRIRPQ